MRDLQRLAQQAATSETLSTGYSLPGQHVSTPEKWTHSTVSKFHVRYSPPMPDLGLDYSVEALVEGSDMSMVHDGACLFEFASTSDAVVDRAFSSSRIYRIHF